MVSTAVENKNYTPEELAGLCRFLEVYRKPWKIERRVKNWIGDITLRVKVDKESMN
ncbi:MAG: hypothetical protein K2M46_06120 [Lachnospiraceae bacterium]|nr:hypothetical protein [Lachnospiraceae bacterium]